MFDFKDFTADTTWAKKDMPLDIRIPAKNTADTDTAWKKRTKRRSHVFNRFPEAPDLYAPEIDVEEIIRRYGPEEWRAGVLTNELHGHLGIYAVIGVKMGVHALELLGTGIDDISVTSYAGSRPPLSCMNDGLQVSTGATVGHGLFQVSQQPECRPKATFHFWNRSVTLELLPEYASRIRENVLEGVRLYGNHTENYWEYIRRLAIRYWKEFDRRLLFQQS